MNASTEQLFDAALALPDGDRVELAAALLASLQPDDRPPLGRVLAGGHSAPVPRTTIRESDAESVGRGEAASAGEGGGR